jgi:tyrosinase
MNTWTHLPKGHQHETGFTTVELPESAIRNQLEALRHIKVFELATELKALREESFATPESISLRIRKNQSNSKFDETLKNAFKAAVNKMIQDGTYAKLVLDHADMSHNMHGSMGTTGLLRFLGWHREYLKQFEDLLIAADRELRPTAIERISLPFWHWNDPFPEWLENYLPARHPGNGRDVPARKNSQPPEKPTDDDISLIINKFRDQLPNTNIPDPNVADYVRFTYALEGWGKRPDGTNLPSHNHVHDWTGGIMSNVEYSPTDPIFWLHHAEVDRIWSVWQVANPNAHPSLNGNNRIFDPWNATYDTVKSIEGMGYTYEAV